MALIESITSTCCRVYLQQNSVCVCVCVCVLISHAVHPAAESARVFYFSTQTLNDDMNALSLFVNAYMMLTESVNMINIFRDCVFMLVIHS